MILNVRDAASLRRSASGEKSSISLTWKWTNEPCRSRKEGPERKPDSCRATARTLSPAWNTVREPDQRAGFGQDAAVGKDPGAHGQARARRGAHRRLANGKRRATTGEVRLSRQADRHWRHLPPRCPYGGAAFG